MEFHGKMEGLEQIFWRDGKFIDVNEKEVNPKMIGPAFILGSCNSILGSKDDMFKRGLINKFNELKKKYKIYEEANSYSIGTEEDYHVPYTINFTKI